MESFVMPYRAKKLIKWDLFNITLIIFIIFVGCAGQVEEKQENSENEVIKPPPPPANQLAPGTAKVEAQIINFTELDNHFECIIKVEKVLRYGRTTKPIGKGTELILHISKAQSDLIKLLSNGTSEQKYEFIVEQAEVVIMPSGQSMWKAIEASKEQLEQ
jgi:hypothetical protein